jgi:hypothetical protein
MHRSPLYLMALFSVLMAPLLSGCNPDKNKLIFKPSPGSARMVDTEDAFNFSINMAGMSMGFGMSRDSTYRMTAESVAPDGVVTLNVTLESTTMDLSGLDALLGGAMGGPQGASGMPAIPGLPSGDDPLGTKALKTAMDAAKGESFKVRVNRHGEIIEVSGADAIAEKVANAYKAPGGLPAVEMKMNIRNMLGNQGMKNSLQQIFVAAPDKPLTAGSSWNTQLVNDSAGVPVTADTTITLKERANGFLTFDTALQLAFDMKSGPMKELLDNPNVKADMKGNGSGSLKFDEGTGWLVDSLSTGTVNGNISFQVPQGGGSFAIPIEVAYKGTVKTYPQ